MKYKFLPHTADIKFQAFGNDLEECFTNAGNALMNIIVKKKVKPASKKIIKVKARDISALLYNFLEEFLYFLDVGDFLVGEIKNLKILGGVKRVGNKKDYVLTCEVYGDDKKNYKTEGDVKAITYNDMFVRQEKGKFICQVVVDV